MTAPKILTLVGGISQGSLNKKLFNAFKALVGAKAEFVLADIAGLPYFSQDLENDPPDSVIRFKDQIREADAILFVTPENITTPSLVSSKTPLTGAQGPILITYGRKCPWSL